MRFAQHIVTMCQYAENVPVNITYGCVLEFFYQFGTLSVFLDGQHLRHECHPTYLGVTLNHKLSYREHLTKTAGKLKNRNNLLIELAGSTGGASANTLWSSALKLCYSAAECCAPVWSRSAHTSQVDVQLNSTMHLISGTHRSTPTIIITVNLYSAFFCVKEPQTRCKSHGFQCSPTLNRQPYKGRLPLTSWWRKSSNTTVGQSRLISSTHHFWLTSTKPLWLDLQRADIKSQWRHNWKSAQVVSSHLVCDPTIRRPGFVLPRQRCSLLDHFRTRQGHCSACGGRWQLIDTDMCPCGETWTTVGSCPLTGLDGGLSLCSAGGGAVSWLHRCGSWHAHEKKKTASYHRQQTVYQTDKNIQQYIMLTCCYCTL